MTSEERRLIGEVGPLPLPPPLVEVSPAPPPQLKVKLLPALVSSAVPACSCTRCFADGSACRRPQSPLSCERVQSFTTLPASLAASAHVGTVRQSSFGCPSYMTDRGTTTKHTHRVTLPSLASAMLSTPPLSSPTRPAD